MELNRNKIEISENTKAIALKAIRRNGIGKWLILISHVKTSQDYNGKIFTIYRHISLDLTNNEIFIGNSINEGRWGDNIGYDFYIPTQEERMFIKNELKRRGFKFIPILNKLIKK